MIRILLLGASGSIGQQTLDVLAQFPDRISLAGFSVGQRTECIPAILERFHPACAALLDEKKAASFSDQYPQVKFYAGQQGISQMVHEADCDMVVDAIMGFAGLAPALSALEEGRELALANKETLVAAGELVTHLAEKKGIRIRPIDSEHSAIWQCLRGNQLKDVDKLLITASGGALRGRSREQLKSVTVEEALAHPNWKMGRKITIDSATMMNKGFEVIEAHWLFDLPYERIQTVLHPQSLVHSMVQYKDHSIIAQLGAPDMRIPIEYALLYPERKENATEPLDFSHGLDMRFDPMPLDRYPLLKLAYHAGKKGGNLCAVLNGANEAAVHAFLERKIPYLRIEELVEKAVRCAENGTVFAAHPTYEQIVQADAFGRDCVRREIEQ